MKISDRIEKLRKRMSEEGIGVCLIPTEDYHGSEYLADYFKVREYFSGFTGSAGSLVVSSKKAALFTDSRYFIQAKNQLENTGIELVKMGTKDAVSIDQYILDLLSPNDILAFDGRVLNALTGEKLKKTIDSKGCSIKTDFDPAEGIWENRPLMEFGAQRILDEKYCGESTFSKISRIREMMGKLGASVHVISALDEIAWILNLRGCDIECNPVFFAYLVITENVASLYANVLDEHIKDYLDGFGVKVFDYTEFYAASGENICTKQRVLLDKERINMQIYDSLSKCNEIIWDSDPAIAMKAIKNDSEIEAIHCANVKDGVAMVRFNKWLDEAVHKGESLSEISVSDKLHELRLMDEEMLGLSFETISAYGKNGAIVHYSATPETNLKIIPGSFLLMDSGAQYYGGTTDVTRTYAIGEVDEKLKHDYTMVLKAMLKIMNFQFPLGADSHNVDTVGRMFFWERGMDFGHGTGHGIGAGLNVHENPVFISWKSLKTPTVFEPGMLCSDEPGIYIEGEYGIRLETDVLCENRIENEYGSYLGFRPMTFVPIDTKPIMFDDMDEDSIRYLNEYHRVVFEELSPFMEGEELEYLKKITKPVGK